MNRRWRVPLGGAVCWLLSLFGAVLLERAHLGTEHMGLNLIGLASGLFAGSLYGAIIPREQRNYLGGAIIVFIILSAGGVQRYLAAHHDLDLLQPAMFGGAACGMALTLWYRARASQAEVKDNPRAQSPAKQCGRR